MSWALISEVATLSKVAPAPKSILTKVPEAVNLDIRKVWVFSLGVLEYETFMQLLTVLGTFEAPFVDCSFDSPVNLFSEWAEPAAAGQYALGPFQALDLRWPSFVLFAASFVGCAFEKPGDVFSAGCRADFTGRGALETFRARDLCAPVLLQCLWVDRHLQLCCVACQLPFQQTRRHVLGAGRPSTRWAIRVSAASRFARSSEVAEGKRSHAHGRHADLDMRQAFTISLPKARQGLER